MSDYYATPEAVLPLFAQARRTDPDTSHQAAERARRFVTGHARAVLVALEAGPAGQTEIGRRCGLLPHQVNKRLADLAKRGLVELTGRKVEANAEREWRAKDGRRMD